MAQTENYSEVNNVVYMPVV